MDAPNGGMTRSSTLIIKTLLKAAEWARSYSPIESDLPLRIEQRADSGGRLMIRIFSNSGKLLESRG